MKRVHFSLSDLTEKISKIVCLKIQSKNSEHKFIIPCKGFLSIAQNLRKPDIKYLVFYTNSNLEPILITEVIFENIFEKWRKKGFFFIRIWSKYL